MERTLVLIKPMAVAFGAADAIKVRYRIAGFHIVSEHYVWMSAEQVRTLYAEHVGREYFPAMLDAFTRGPCIVLELEGEHTIQFVRELHGHPDPLQAAKGTIRGDFRDVGGPFNAVHGSENPEAVVREHMILFGTPPAW